ncbi:hypothetical protein BASA60_001477 [Batrachochytrium salamandrivorans]|nr:hypothetical protein BASA60_001477 [Batrachochytrium salamandrivorans]
MWRLCIAPKVCHSTIIGHFWVLQGSQFRSIASTWHKISDACAHGCSLDSKKAIQIGILVDTHPFSADHCILCDQQLLSTSIAHLVVDCEQVAGHRIQSGLVPAIQKSRLRLLGRATRSGCGACIYLAPRWSLNGEADLDQRWLDGTVEHESMGTRHDNRALAARLADFLQVAYWAVSIHIVEIPPGSPCGSWLTDL